MSEQAKGNSPAKLGAALNAVHNVAVFNRRVEVLVRHLAEMIPIGGRVLDLGCGDGSIALALMGKRPDLSLEGVDVLLRPDPHIPVTLFDGHRLPFDDKSFDYVTIVDVLHHTDDPVELVGEAARVARRGVVIKDHRLKGVAAGATLRFMDYVGNRGHGVRLPYNYLDDARWEKLFQSTGCTVVQRLDRLGIYPGPFSLLFDRQLHFMALLYPDGAGMA